LLFIGLLFAAAGCGSSTEDGGRWELGADSDLDNDHPDTQPPSPDPPAPDAGGPSSDTNPPDPDPDPETVTFRLVNGSKQPIRYVEPGCQSTDADWRQIRVDTSREGSGSSGGAGNAMAPAHMDHNNCRGCRCSAYEDGSGCGVACFACPPGQTGLLEPGEEVTYEWDGSYLRNSQTDDGQSCQRQYEAQPDQPIDAELCWYTGAEKRPTEVEPECAPVSFDIDENDTVEHVVEPVDTESTTFRLQNNSRNHVFVKRLGSCQTTPTDWVQVGRLLPTDGFERYRITSLHCSECRCEAIEQTGGCPVCDAPCVDGDYERVPAGETYTYEWDGPMYERDSVEGQSCLRRIQPDRGTNFRARFCFVEPSEDGTLPENPRTNLHCRPLQGGYSFGYGEGETVSKLVTLEE
jgi:hypothetical protein